MNQPNPAPRPPYYRATFSLPAPLASDISRLAKRLGVSQSSLLSELLADPIAAMLSIMDALPPQHATADDVRRAKGRSLDLIRGIVAEAQQLSREAGGGE